MKPFYLTAGLLLLNTLSPVQGQAPPEHPITNGLVRVILYPPNKESGYYRGTRFDWSGAFKSLEYKGHQYADPWFEHYNPQTHDAICGPAEEFTPLGFEEAGPGGTFLKIGVGVLRRPDDKPYTFSKLYEIADGGRWTAAFQPDQVAYQHTLTDSGGYAYEYTKTIRLVRGKPEMILEHRLLNKGRKAIETSVYNHNFFVIDGERTGPKIGIRFPFDVSGEGKGFGSVVLPENKTLVFSRELEKTEHVYSAGLQGFGPTARDYDIRIENRRTGASVRATADQPIEKLVFWACATTACPEPYIRLKAAPGEEIRWTISYQFYLNPAP